MKVSQAISYHLQYHQANSKKKKIPLKRVSLFYPDSLPDSASVI